MNILYIAYSCNPFAGSEDKIGWCVPYESSKTNKVYVVTKEEQREPVEKYLQSHPLENIKFYYVDIPNFYKKIFKGFMYSGRLNVWNRRVLPLAKKICANQKIDVIHQITPIEFRAIGDYGKICRINTKEGWKDNLSYLQRQAQWLEITYSLCEGQRVRETA